MKVSKIYSWNHRVDFIEFIHIDDSAYLCRNLQCNIGCFYPSLLKHPNRIPYKQRFPTVDLFTEFNEDLVFLFPEKKGDSKMWEYIFILLIGLFTGKIFPFYPKFDSIYYNYPLEREILW